MKKLLIFGLFLLSIHNQYAMYPNKITKTVVEKERSTQVTTITNPYTGPMNLVKKWVDEVAEEAKYPSWCKDVNVKYGKPQYNYYSNTLYLPITDWNIKLGWDEKKVNQLELSEKNELEKLRQEMSKEEKYTERGEQLTQEEHYCYQSAKGLSNKKDIISTTIKHELAHKFHHDELKRDLLCAGVTAVIASFGIYHIAQDIKGPLFKTAKISSAYLGSAWFANRLSDLIHCKQCEYRADSEAIKRTKNPQLLKDYAACFRAMDKSEKTYESPTFLMFKKFMDTHPPHEKRAQRFDDEASKLENNNL